MEIKYRLDLIKLLPDNPVTAELGVAEGYFSEHICKEWNPAHHYLVDNWGTLETKGDGNFHQLWHNKNYHAVLWRMHPFKHKSTILKGITWNMAQHIQDEHLDIVYIDAGHSYDDVRKDLEAWYPKV